ncbi:MAG: hypothetical protein ACU84Q_11805 [Gammaproteobacteria bacterium]
MFVGTLLIIPIIVVSLPVDYFVRSKRTAEHKRTASIAKLLMVVIKNAFGLLLIIAGIFMLVLPGQGLLTILLGFMLTNFPGKYYLERKLVQTKTVSNSINWIRERANRPPMIFGGTDP